MHLVRTREAQSKKDKEPITLLCPKRERERVWKLLIDDGVTLVYTQSSRHTRPLRTPTLLTGPKLPGEAISEARDHGGT